MAVLRKIACCSAILLSAILLRGGEKMPELKTVEHVDVDRYMGTWYEIAKYPASFEKGLVGITANYTLLLNGKVRVINQGHKKSLDGKLSRAKGKAWLVDKKSNAKLKVRFFWPFSGNYWIIELGENYQYAVVGEPKRKYLWILSRTPKMEEAVYDGLLEKIKAHGYDPAKLEKTSQ